MIAAEKRYQDYENYSNGLTQNQNSKVNLSFAAKAKLIFLLIAIGAMCITMIISSAYITQIKYNINETAKEVKMCYDDIENIQVKIEKQSKARVIEERALNELGMVYPEGNQIVYLENNMSNETEFASILREAAFN